MKKPSDYIRDMYFTSQPMEMVDNRKALELTFELVNAETQLLYSSDYPHWDMDLPSTIYDLPFLSQQAKRNILGENARKLFKLVNTAFYAKAEQPIIIVVHSQGIVPVHAYLALYPEAASQVHAVLAYNPIWGGSVIADNIAGLPADVQKLAAGQGLTGATAKDVTYKSRQEMVRSFPLDFNSFRVMVAATHLQASKEFLPSLQYLRKYSKTVSDGIITLQDQIIPGARAVMLDKLDHDDLVYASPATAPVNSTVAAQAMLYTLFKLTP